MHRRTLALLVVVLAAAMDLTDGTVVNIVLPVIQRDLGAGDGTAAAIATAYTLALGSLLVTGGRLGDLLGHRRMLAAGTLGFVAASLLCAMAPTAGWLVAGRALQGVASALLVPQTLAVIQHLYPADERGRALGVFAAVAGVATVSGPLLGALLTSADLFGCGWRAVFAVNLPVGALVLAGLVFVPSDRASGANEGAHKRDLDLTGTLLLTAVLLLFVAPLLWSTEAGDPAWAVLPLAATAPVVWVLTRQQRRRVRSGRAPVVDPVVFGFRSFVGALLITLVSYAAVFALFLTLALFLQGELGWSPLAAALTVLPWALGIPLASSPASTHLVPRFGRRVLVAGLGTMILGLSALAWLLSGDPDPWTLAPALLVAGLGMGLVVAPTLGLGLADVPTHLAGTASGLLNNAQHVAGAAGIGVLGGLYAATGGMGPTLIGVVALLALALPATRLLPRLGKPAEMSEAGRSVPCDTPHRHGDERS